jgi:hypothetical protein
MPRISEQVEWLSLVDISGPFLVPAVLEQVFPQGLEKVETPRRQRIRSAYEEWRDAVDDDDSQLREMHAAWVLMVLQDMLEYEDTVLVSRQALDAKCVYRAPESGAEAVPDYAVRGDDGKLRLLVSVWPPETDLEKAVSGDPWPASPLERMNLLCRANDVRLGLVTDGERWMVVNAPIGATSGYAAWLARLWWQEPVTLKAFQSLLGVRRCFGPKEETLNALLERSTEFQEEVTDTLGEQVRRAVEILVQSLGRADQDRNGELLKDVRPAELYEAGLTLMMRMVFTLCAEERGLLLLGDPAYDQHYAISTLRSRLREDADRFGVEVLERRHDAWSRMLAVFRAIYAGVEHESLRMPALGGSLFDPDRFPLLEGRAKGTTWRETPSAPLPIDNRTVLMLLDALQVLEQKGGAQLLSYRALDVEQIGHVYEGLLEYTAAKLDEVTVGLTGSQKVRHPSITMGELETLKLHGQDKAIEYLAEMTGRSAAAIGKALTRGGDEQALLQLVHACGGDEKLARCLLPFANLVRADSWGTMLVYKPGSFAVVHGSDRRETGTHYTPKSLTESIVEKTLEPIVYVGPAEGEPRERWKLKPPAELLDLKICDPAMGSGAFLVQVCRYLSERLVEAWAQKESDGKAITTDGIVLDMLGGTDPMPKSLDERLVAARRLIAERCLYGVDINPLAVELAKLSIWLVTMAKGRPFGFLDHNLRSGDSLLGIHALDQLTKLALKHDDVGHQQRLFAQSICKCVAEAVAIRSKLRSISIRDIRDVEAMAHLDLEARRRLEAVELVADAMIGEALRLNGNVLAIDSALDSLALQAEEFLNGNEKTRVTIAKKAREALSSELSEGRQPRKPIHWPLEFPEVFVREDGGFDAMMGNPPFVGGRRMRGAIGDAMMTWLKVTWPHSSMNADYCAFFYLRAASLLRARGSFGFLGTKTIGQGDTARTGLSYLADKMSCTVRYALSFFVWPGTASVVAALVIGQKGHWGGIRTLDQREVMFISPVLDDQAGWGNALRLPGNTTKSFQGSVLVGMGFVLTPKEAREYIELDDDNRLVIKPYLDGDDLNSHPEQKASRWVIDFRNLPLEECVKKWPKLIERIRQLVKPAREAKRGLDYGKLWWQHWRPRPELYSRIQSRSEVFVQARVTKYVAIVSVPADQVFHDKVYVFDLSSWAHFSALQCSFHDAWVRRGSSTVGETLNYTPSDYFDTYPFLHLNDSDLQLIGKRYHDVRKAIMLRKNEGLSNTYNRFHNPEVSAEDISQLRQLHTDMDRAVALAYGWRDLDLQHGFHETKQGVRFTISDTARRAVLSRLLILNHQRYDEEVKAELHTGNEHKYVGKKTMPNHNERESEQERRLFRVDEQ